MQAPGDGLEDLVVEVRLEGVEGGGRIASRPAAEAVLDEAQDAFADTIGGAERPFDQWDVLREEVRVEGVAAAEASEKGLGVHVTREEGGAGAMKGRL